MVPTCFSNLDFVNTHRNFAFTVNLKEPCIEIETQMWMKCNRKMNKRWINLVNNIGEDEMNKNECVQVWKNMNKNLYVSLKMMKKWMRGELTDRDKDEDTVNKNECACNYESYAIKYE